MSTPSTVLQEIERLVMKLPQSSTSASALADVQPLSAPPVVTASSLAPSPPPALKLDTQPIDHHEITAVPVVVDARHRRGKPTSGFEYENLTGAQVVKRKTSITSSEQFKKAIPIVIIVVVLLGFVATAIFLYFRQKKKQREEAKALEAAAAMSATAASASASAASAREKSSTAAPSRTGAQLSIGSGSALSSSSNRNQRKTNDNKIPSAPSKLDSSDFVRELKESVESSAASSASAMPMVQSANNKLATIPEETSSAVAADTSSSLVTATTGASKVPSAESSTLSQPLD